jgi:PAS domain S-box-containing protein
VGRVLAALALALVAFGLRLALIPAIGIRAPFALFFLATLLAGWFGGAAAGSVTLIASTALSFPLLDRLRLATPAAVSDQWSIALFVAVAGIMLAAGEGARRARDSAETDRAESERVRATLEQVLHAAHMGYWSWDIPTNKVAWSENLERVHGVAPGSFGGTFDSFLALVHGEDRPLIQEAVAHALETGSQYHVEFRVPRPDGGVEWVAGDGRVEMEDGKPVRMTGIGTNITERRRADEDRLLLASIVDSSDDAIISKDLQGRLLSWNRAAERMFGYTAEEAIGQSVAMLLPPEKSDEFFTNMDRIRRGEKVVHHETLRRRKDGTVIEAALTISPIHDETGRIIGASKIGRDISALKQAERERQRTRELFLGILGHDLRNPLNTIVASVFVLEKEVPDASKRLLPRIARSADRMRRMIDQLLDFTRARLGEGIPLTRAPGDLAEIARAMVEDLEPTFAGRVHIQTDGPIVGMWDSDRVQQALSNLIVNGLKHGAPECPVEVQIGRLGGDALVQVVNSGSPIPESERLHIFEPFRRAAAEPSRDSSGLGLGLYIVREIIRAHDGEIDVESGGNHTTFRLRLPVVPTESSPGAAPSE